MSVYAPAGAAVDLAWLSAGWVTHCVVIEWRGRSEMWEALVMMVGEGRADAGGRGGGGEN